MADYSVFLRFCSNYSVFLCFSADYSVFLRFWSNYSVFLRFSADYSVFLRFWPNYNVFLRFSADYSVFLHFWSNYNVFLRFFHLKLTRILSLSIFQFSVSFLEGRYFANPPISHAGFRKSTYF